jgi:hypothetical protein
VAKDVLFISYFTGIRGMVMAEWADDKIRVLESLKLKTIVITGISSGSPNTEFTTYVKVPPLSWREFKFERTQVQDHSGWIKLIITLYFPIAALTGRVFDLVSRKIITTQNPAKWSWAFSAFPIAAYLGTRHKIRRVFATGGALSGQLLACLLKPRGNREIYLEFQDPIVGNEIIRTSTNTRLMNKLESFLLSKSNRSFFVTRAAALSAQIRHPNLDEKISWMYPGAWKYQSESQRDGFESKTISLIHLGTLYGSRNMDNLFTAIENLKFSNQLQGKEFKLTNVGAIYLENNEDYLKRPYFTQFTEVERTEALQIAGTADFLLLIQHKDNRSLETIPYKTYDYLNLGMPILGLTNNPELDELIQNHGGMVADATSVLSIQNVLIKIISDSKPFKEADNRQVLDITHQFMNLLNLGDLSETKTRMKR